MAEETTSKSNSLGTIAAVAGIAAVAAVFGIAMEYEAGADEFSRIAEKARPVPVVKPVDSSSPSAAVPMTVALSKEATRSETEPANQPERTAAGAPVTVTQTTQVVQASQAPQSRQPVTPFDPAPAGTPAAGSSTNHSTPSVLSYPVTNSSAPATYQASAAQAPAYPSPPPGSAVPVPVTAPAAVPYPPAVATQQTQSFCGNCGTVENVIAQTTSGDASGLGAVIGGVAGGLLGNQVGRGSGRTVATIAGAAGGAYAGHQI